MYRLVFDVCRLFFWDNIFIGVFDDIVLGGGLCMELIRRFGIFFLGVLVKLGIVGWNFVKIFF